MWHIDLVDIKGNGLVVGFDTNVDTLTEAELIAVGEIRKCLQDEQIELAYEDELVYEVWRLDKSIGCVHIKSL